MFLRYNKELKKSFIKHFIKIKKIYKEYCINNQMKKFDTIIQQKLFNKTFKNLLRNFKKSCGTLLLCSYFNAVYRIVKWRNVTIICPYVASLHFLLIFFKVLFTNSPELFLLNLSLQTKRRKGICHYVVCEQNF